MSKSFVLNTAVKNKPEKPTMALRLSQSSLIYLNLALGLLVAVANGAALIVVLGGKEERLTAQVPEIAVWSIAGLILAITAGYALRRTDRTAEILRVQTYLVIALVVGLTAWALMLMTGAISANVRVVWAVGYLSILALYCAILGSHAFPDARYSLHRRLLTWVFLPICVVVDILTYVKIAD
jgi:FtsH-binding integral membrane protein